MNHKSLMLQIDPNLTFSVNTQIKEQLKWLIGTGKIELGDMLPAAGQLADSLGLNRNTVNWVYNQLRDEGLVTMHKGRGTIVSHGPRVEQLRKEREPMHRLLTETINSAQTEGMELQSFFMAGLAYVLLQDPSGEQGRRIVLVECKEHDYLFYQSEIQRITGCEVDVVFTEQLANGERLSDDVLTASDMIITTVNHADEVRKIMVGRDLQIHVIGATLEPQTLLNLAKLSEGTQVTFVCLGKAGGEWMASRVEDAGVRQIRSQSLGIGDQGFEQNLDKIRQSDKIYASSAAFHHMQNLVPEKVELYPMQLEASSEILLEELADSLEAKSESK
ncbi:GntR family transcriptional regulator [Gorillibacterium timonense]|uniref:GntR family transcriptional regulator n=1 Tax=Gorillibacterium timonense TaxID=1689269 RepID=UPI00071D73E2|nr:GntR family transcriptional regulator [Gorillibacterium timonense]